MAIQTRYAGDAQGVNNVDVNTDGTLATIVATGLTIALGKSQQFAASDSATGGPVETILRTIGIDSTVVMYQVDTDRLSVLVEAAGNTVTNIGGRITAQGNLSTTLGTGNVWANAATVSSNTGFKIA
jgi:hypothetical protein